MPTETPLCRQTVRTGRVPALCVVFGSEGSVLEVVMGGTPERLLELPELLPVGVSAERFRELSEGAVLA